MFMDDLSLFELRELYVFLKVYFRITLLASTMPFCSTFTT